MPQKLQIVDQPAAVDAAEWDALLEQQRAPTPFMRMEYLAALHASGSATRRTGWTPRFFLLREDRELVAACPVYVKSHSWGEYVFDFAWANAYAEHGLDYYPKAVVAVPFTPVPGSRLLAKDAVGRAALVRHLLDWCAARQLSSLHVLFCDAADATACAASGLMARRQVEFHWHNRHPQTGEPFADFGDFLTALARDKRKKIRQERRRVRDAGVTFRSARGRDITPEDWAFFYRCYERTYLEHGNAPYLTPAFFAAMAERMAATWLLFIAERRGEPIACSLIGLQPPPHPRSGAVAYGRYWGAIERVDCLHFEACYYQPIEWCIAHGVTRFEGGAQGEHKLARALLPAMTQSAHWIAHPAFAQAIARFLARENAGVERYRAVLDEHAPYAHAAQPG
ncbi:MAG: N-acetyltransferase [Burkholderiaceae bacterium]|nr:MAG: N-acetyltransferase [Burkholderiaceae bacterium]